MSKNCTLNQGKLGLCAPLAGAILLEDLQLIGINEETEAVMFPKTRSVINVCPFCGAKLLEGMI